MEVLTELEVESGLRLLHIGREPNEVVSMLLESRNCNLVTAMRRDVQKILLREQKKKAELIVCRSVWDIIKEKDKKVLKHE